SVVADAAARVTPVAGDAGHAGDSPKRHPSAAMALDADADANARRPCCCPLPPQLDDRLDGQARDRGDTRRRELEDALAERLPPNGVPLDERGVLLALREGDVEQAER